ncbi:MAG TPA: hypothetical protein PLC79_07655 [Phycisphaerae bacterium]|nr:hypothetical protein [Phycisphaerae bacterium]
MFLRSKRRFENGKWHRYYSVVQNRRLPGDRVAQSQVLYLGEINDSQDAAWRKTLEVFDEQRRTTCPMSLFPEDREVAPDAVNALSLRMTELVMPRYIEPEADQQLILDTLRLALPPQPPPRIRSGAVIRPAAAPPCSADL